MLQYIREYEKYVEITGYRSIEFNEAENFLKLSRNEPRPDTMIQFFNAQLIATHEHLYFAVLNAMAAFKNQTNLSKNLAMETILYASSQRQIKKAIHLLGIKQDMKNLAAVIIGENSSSVQEVTKEISHQFRKEPDETVLDLSEEKISKIQDAFKITNAQLETLSTHDKQQAIVNLVIEQVALLATQL